MSRSGQPSNVHRRRLLWALLAVVMLAIAFTAVMAPRWSLQSVGEPPMTLGNVPDFALANRDGRTITATDLEGAPWVANFIFTRCAISCPRMTSRMVQLEKLWPKDVEIARVSFSVDPDYDSPEVLQTYAESWGIEDPRWFFLTGDREIMQAVVMDGFKLAVDMDPPPGTFSPEEPILHSTRFVLVDAAGAIRGYYDVIQGEEIERLARDLRALLAADS